MSETRFIRPSLWVALLAAFVAAAVWATVALASGGSGSGSSGTGSPVVSYDRPHAMYAASGGSNAAGDCPNMGGSSGSSTTPSAPSTPSTENGSSNPAL
jgi:hypothetical protein